MNCAGLSQPAETRSLAERSTVPTTISATPIVARVLTSEHMRLARQKRDQHRVHRIRIEPIGHQARSFSRLNAVTRDRVTALPLADLDPPLRLRQRQGSISSAEIVKCPPVQHVGDHFIAGIVGGRDILR